MFVLNKYEASVQGRALETFVSPISLLFMGQPSVDYLVLHILSKEEIWISRVEISVINSLASYDLFSSMHRLTDWSFWAEHKDAVWDSNLQLLE
jgi:hypothetical protein